MPTGARQASIGSFEVAREPPRAPMEGEPPMSSISPVAGALPQQPTARSSCATAPPPLQSAPAMQPASATAPPTAAAGVAPATAAGGGLVQAAQGVQATVPDELIPVLQQLVDVLAKLVAALPPQGGVAGGGGAVGQCGMVGCTMDHAAGAAPMADARAGVGAAGAPTAAGANAGPGVARVAPSSVKDQVSPTGLTAASVKGLEVAHSFGLPLVSGKRGGNASASEHPSGRAIDVGTLAIRDASSTKVTPAMNAYAEHMRAEARAGRLDVKYIIRDGQIASPTNNWEWRAYTYPGESTSSLEKMKSSDRGNYNRLQHFDHVHVSFN